MFRCECGHEVGRHDVLQVGVILRPHRPICVIFKFRCPRCGRIGERLVEYPHLAAFIPSRAAVREGDEERFREMGPITVDEVIEFHRQLKRLKALPPDFLAEPPGGDED